MSGYDPTMGAFEITSKKLNAWLRREPTTEDLNAGRDGAFDPSSEIDIAAYLFRKFGYEVLKRGSGYIRVRATPEQAWEALSGMPADPKHFEWYYNNPTRLR